jgi:hypothetical protein
MTISVRRASFLRQAIALAIAAAIIIVIADAGHAAGHPPGNASETGWQSELVNRPGCWNLASTDNPHSCEAAGLR